MDRDGQAGERVLAPLTGEACHQLGLDAVVDGARRHRHQARAHHPHQRRQHAEVAVVDDPACDGEGAAELGEVGLLALARGLGEAQGPGLAQRRGEVEAGDGAVEELEAAVAVQARNQLELIAAPRLAPGRELHRAAEPIVVGERLQDRLGLDPVDLDLIGERGAAARAVERQGGADTAAGEHELLHRGREHGVLQERGNAAPLDHQAAVGDRPGLDAEVVVDLPQRCQVEGLGALGREPRPHRQGPGVGLPGVERLAQPGRQPAHRGHVEGERAVEPQRRALLHAAVVSGVDKLRGQRRLERESLDTEDLLERVQGQLEGHPFLVVGEAALQARRRLEARKVEGHREL